MIKFGKITRENMTFHKANISRTRVFVQGTISLIVIVSLILNEPRVVNGASGTTGFDKGIQPDKSGRDNKSGALIDGTRGRTANSAINNNANNFENNNHNNELHATNFNFDEMHIGDEELKEDGDAREIDEGSYYDYNDGENEFNSEEDLHNVFDHDEHDFPRGKPQIGKCCPYGQGLNIQGVCKAMNPVHLQHHEKLWFPDQVYDAAKESLIPTNISEWEIIADHRTDCGPDHSTEIVSDMKRFAILTDGRLYLAYSKKNAKFLSPLEFCVEQELGKGEGRVVRSCFSRKDLCGESNCLRKCCPEGAVVEEPSAKCSSAHVVYKAHPLHDPNLSVIHATPSCQYGQHLQPIEDGYNISDDGSLITSEIRAPFLHYCLDHFLDVNMTNKSLELKALICFEPKEEKVKGTGKVPNDLPKGVAIVYGIAFIVSSFCLAFAAAVSWRLPELRSLHGKCQLSHLGTLFCLFFFLAAVHLGTENMPDGLCTFSAVMIHMCALSSFMWLNLLCVNIYLTFRSLRPPLAARRDENRRLFFLCVYAWGIPAAFCIFLFILDSTPGRLDPMPQPQYGVKNCLISNRQAEFAYLYGPVGVLLLCNGLLFCLTAQELLCGLWRLDNAESLTFRRKSMGIVVAKLGIVMGMGWILDVLSWAVGEDFPYMFFAADFFNALQGLFICLVLIWRKRVLEVLHIRKPSLTKDETLTARPFLPKHSINSTGMQGDHDTSLVIVQES